MKDKHILIIGAGVIGLSCAYFLNKKGYKVTVVDNTDGTDNCSHGNAGLIVPDHIIPLASPGIINQGLRWMLRSDSPFYIKPKFDGDLIRWGLKFRQAATKKKINVAAPVLNDLLVKSRRLQEQLLTEEAIDVGFNDSGMLIYFKTQKSFDEEIHIANKVKYFGQQVEILNAEETKKINPNLEVHTVGSVYYKDDAALTPRAYISKLKEVLIHKGVDILFDKKVVQFTVKNAGAIGDVLMESGEKIIADEFIVAAGAWTKTILKTLGVNLPLQGGKGYSLRLPTAKINFNTPFALSEARVVANPMLDGLLFAGTMEINGLDLSIDRRRIQGMIKSICDYLPQFSIADFEGVEPWAGFRPCSPDGLPYIGRTNNYHNLIVATGHAMLGMSLGPVTGQLIGQIVNDEAIEEDVSLLDVNRYK